MERKQNIGKKVLLGGAAGAVNGLLGGGGGMLAVPALERFLPARKAHATAIALILPCSLLSGIVYLLSGRVPMSVFLPVACGVTAGGFLGANLLPRLPVRLINFLFGLFMLAAGVRMVL